MKVVLVVVAVAVMEQVNLLLYAQQLQMVLQILVAVQVVQHIIQQAVIKLLQLVDQE
jgi:hypothetical protein